MSTEADSGTGAQIISLDAREEIRRVERPARSGWTGSSWRDYLLLVASLLLIALGLIFGLSGTS